MRDKSVDAELRRSKKPGAIINQGKFKLKSKPCPETSSPRRPHIQKEIGNYNIKVA
jgi:hypothetical protein